MSRSVAGVRGLSHTVGLDMGRPQERGLHSFCFAEWFSVCDVSIGELEPVAIMCPVLAAVGRSGISGQRRQCDSVSMVQRHARDQRADRRRHNDGGPERQRAGRSQSIPRPIPSTSPTAGTTPYPCSDPDRARAPRPRAPGPDGDVPAESPQRARVLPDGRPGESARSPGEGKYRCRSGRSHGMRSAANAAGQG